MTIGRVIPQRLPSCPGRNSRHTVRQNYSESGSPWWVFYEDPSGNLIQADDPHMDLVELVNFLKLQQGNQPGGGFSINEHGQIIARMSAPLGQAGQSVHVIGVEAGHVITYRTPITFLRRVLDPTVTPQEGDPWPGPRCGMSYRFAAPGNPKPPSRNFDEVWTEVEGQICQLSVDAGISSYPPHSGPLSNFLEALRHQLPNGGRFRVNEHGRAFTAGSSVFIGCVPLDDWFRPLRARS